MIKQQDYDILRQASRQLYSKCEIINPKGKILESIEGQIVDDSISISATSDIRRTYSSSMVVTNSTFDIARKKMFWFDRLIRPYIGVKHIRSGEIIWYLLGTYTISDSSYQFDTTTSQLDIEFKDKMCLLMPEYGGQASHYSIRIEAGQDVRTTIMGLIREAGEEYPQIGFIQEEIPYDLQFDAGTSYYEILSKIAELFPGWEFYYDIYGTFIFNRVPSCYEDDCVLTYNSIYDLLIKENSQIKLHDIYNKTIIWGQVLDPDFYSENVTLSGDTYIANVDMMTSYENFDTVALHIPANNPVISYININGLGKIRINDDSGTAIAANTMEGDISYVFRYRKSNVNKEPDFYFLGQYQVYGEYTETDNSCEFSVDNVGRELVQTLSFEEIYSNDLAYQRAEYETYLKCRLQDTITLEMASVFWLDVNQKVEYKKLNDDVPSQYIVKEITFSSMDGIMSVTMSKFYEDYNVVYNKKYNNLID